VKKEKHRKEYYTYVEIIKNEKQKLENSYNLNIQQEQKEKENS
jgi:hypothetical protein